MKQHAVCAKGPRNVEMSFYDNFHQILCLIKRTNIMPCKFQPNWSITGQNFGKIKPHFLVELSVMIWDQSSVAVIAKHKQKSTEDVLLVVVPGHYT